MPYQTPLFGSSHAATTQSSLFGHVGSTETTGFGESTGFGGGVGGLCTSTSTPLFGSTQAASTQSSLFGSTGSTGFRASSGFGRGAGGFGTSASALPQQQTQIVLSPTQRSTEPDEQCVQVLFNSGAKPIPPGSLLSVYTTVPMPGSLVISKNPTVGPLLLRVGELMPVPSLPTASLPVTSIDENSMHSADEDESDETMCSGYDSFSDDLTADDYLEKHFKAD